MIIMMHKSEEKKNRRFHNVRQKEKTRYEMIIPKEV